MSAIQTEQVRSEMRPISRILQRDKQAVKRKSVHGIGSVGALHGHALAIANEAMAGYREFANHAADRGHDELADLFSRLFELEAEQAFRLPEAAADMLPRLATGEYGWLYSAEPLPEARDLISCMLTPRLALKIALDAQARAKALFEQMAAASNDAGDRELALELGRGKGSQIAWLQQALMRMPEPFQPDENCPGDPATLQAQ